MTWRKKRSKYRSFHWLGKKYIPVRLGTHADTWVEGYMGCYNGEVFWNKDFTPFVDPSVEFQDLEGVWRWGIIVNKDELYTYLKNSNTIYRVMTKYFPEKIKYRQA